MKRWQAVGLFVLGWIGFPGCGGAISGGSEGGTGGGTGGGGHGGATGGGGADACLPHAPATHRVANDGCSATAKDEPCTMDADCMAASAGQPAKCVDDGSGSMVCDDDQCQHDSDCPGAGDACSCRGQTFGFGHSSFGNVCVPGNCHTDADCAESGYCSPTVSADCGAFYGVQGYYCHTCADECVDDADCAALGAGAYCAYNPTVGHWACGAQGCAG